MLNFIDKPRLVRNEVDARKGPISVKVAYLCGKDGFIDDVIMRRQKDRSCGQLPSPPDDGSHYYTRVTYTVGSTQGVSVRRIDVRFSSGRWSCFYDDENRRGTVELCDGNFHKYFLHSSECVDESIVKYEDALSTARLALIGPDAFPKHKAD